MTSFCLFLRHPKGLGHHHFDWLMPWSPIFGSHQGEFPYLSTCTCEYIRANVLYLSLIFWCPRPGSTAFHPDYRQDRGNRRSTTASLSSERTCPASCREPSFAHLILPLSFSFIPRLGFHLYAFTLASWFLLGAGGGFPLGAPTQSKSSRSIDRLRSLFAFARSIFSIAFSDSLIRGLGYCHLMFPEAGWADFLNLLYQSQTWFLVLTQLFFLRMVFGFCMLPFLYLHSYPNLKVTLFSS